jgi:hypothetical protein
MPLHCDGHCAVQVGSRGACGLKASHSLRGGVHGGVHGDEGVGLATIDDHELLELKSESDSGTAGSNRGRINTPS